MSDHFSFDVFLSHSSKDKAIVRTVAERLRNDGMRVWLDEWEIHPGDSIPAKIEEGLERSRVLVLCMSANAFGSDWAQLEAGTFRFRDPLNKNRRFIPLRLDEAPLKTSLVQFLYVNWLPEHRDREYPKLLEACRVASKKASPRSAQEKTLDGEGRVIFAHSDGIYAVAVTPDGKWVVADTVKSRLKKIELNVTRESLPNKASSVRQAKSSPLLRTVAVTPDGANVLTCSSSNAVELWNLHEMRKIRDFQCPRRPASSVELSQDGTRVFAGSYDGTISIWKFVNGEQLCRIRAHHKPIKAIAVVPDGSCVVSAAEDKEIRVWDATTGNKKEVLKGHSEGVTSLAITRDGKKLISGSWDKTIRIWDLETSRCVAILEGHTARIFSIAVTRDSAYVVSSSSDKTIRVWELKSGECLRIFRGHSKSVRSVRLTPEGRWIISSSVDGTVRVWPMPRGRTQLADATQQYTNAKVLLVGDTSAGKTGLSMRLALDDWKATDSTVGAWATHWSLPMSSSDGVEREIWLWDFGGQADQRLIHQLYMEDTAVAVLVFDGQKEDLFEALGQWDRDLTRASRKAFTKLLVAGRIDAGGLRVSRSQINRFAEERGFSGFLETSAKAGIGCEELKTAILSGIHWAEIPWRSSPRLFKRLREEIIHLKDEGRVLMRFNELRDALRLRLAAAGVPFNDQELKAVVGLLAGPGVLWELAFGSWVLLQPERINAYAQAVIQTMREDKYERGCLPEERVLDGKLSYHSSIKRLEADEERFVLLAMHQTLVERRLCLREHTDKGPVLIFPSYYRRERPELIGHPAVLVSYRFNGFLDDIYATLVVRLHHTRPFEQDGLWRYAADFKTLTGKQLGVKLTRRSDGTGELEVYFDPTISMEEKIIFSKYVHEHLLQSATDVVRLRQYVCPHCGTPVGNREVAMRKLEEGKKDIPCVNCDHPNRRIPLWDEMEELFASEEIRIRVRKLEEQADILLDSESKDRALVGEVISTVALAGQLSRELNVSDHGIDMEIEFKSDAGEATGKKLYLQLKSGDSHLRRRKGDGVEVFYIKDERHARYWMAQEVPVLLVVRNSQGEVRWMEVRDCLRRASENGKTAVKQITFEGDRFDVMSVRRWRDKVLSLGTRKSF